MPLNKVSSWPFTVKIILSICIGIAFWYIARNFIFIQQALYWAGLADTITGSLQTLVAIALNSIGINAQNTHNIITIEGTRGMRIVYGCLAINHIALFTGLIIAYPNKFLHKLWYIPTGIIILHLLNGLRLIFIGLVLNYAPTWDEFAHYYLTRFIMYGGVLLLWLYFILRICKNK